MEKTFQELYEELQSESGDPGSSRLVQFKKWINQGIGIFQMRLKIKDLEAERISSVVAGQVRYQRPEDALRIKGIRYLDGTRKIPLIEVPDDLKWERMQTNVQSGIPVYWHRVGEDMYELFPIPSGDVASGLYLRCKIRQKPLSAANYTTGTVSVSANGNTITGVGTTFTPAMVGRRFKFADGTGNGIWYRIADYTSATVMTLENYYSDSAVSGGSYTIAEIPELPPTLHQTLFDFAMWRFQLGQENPGLAREYRALWEDAVDSYQPRDDTEEQVYNSQPQVNGIFPNLLQTPRNVS